jgi:hypothetical protein
MRRTVRGQGGWARLDSDRRCGECRYHLGKDGKPHFDHWGGRKDAWCWMVLRQGRKWSERFPVKERFPASAYICDDFEADFVPPGAGR